MGFWRVNIWFCCGIGFYSYYEKYNFRRLFMGSPTILMENGRFVYKNLKRVKMDINDFLETARIAGYFDVSKIKYALMEANGKISFMLKGRK